MKVATWNVNSLKIRMPRVVEFLEQHRPDVLALQETKSESATFPHGEFLAAGYHAVEHSAGRWAGVAIAAKQELEITDECGGLEGEVVVDEARWIEATVGDVRIASVYVPNGRAVGTEAFDQKLRFYEAMADRAAALDGTKLLIAGDMNVCREDIDVYDPAAFVGSTHVTEEERSRFEAILERGNLADAYRQLHRDEVGFTWWDYRAGHFHKRLGLRIDYILASQDLAQNLTMCGIDRNYRKGQKPSDHAPLIAEL